MTRRHMDKLQGIGYHNTRFMLIPLLSLKFCISVYLNHVKDKVIP